MLGRLPHRIAERGIRRTFQNLAVRAMVFDNVRIGGHARSRGNFASDALRLPWVRRDEQALNETAWSLLHMLPLDDVALRPARMPLGTGKRVERLGRWSDSTSSCCSTSRRAKLNHGSRRTGDLIRRIRDEQQVTILLVEHPRT